MHHLYCEYLNVSFLYSSVRAVSCIPNDFWISVQICFLHSSNCWPSFFCLSFWLPLICSTGLTHSLHASLHIRIIKVLRFLLLPITIFSIYISLFFSVLEITSFGSVSNLCPVIFLSLCIFNHCTRIII